MQSDWLSLWARYLKTVYAQQVEFLHLEYSVHQRLFETALRLPVVAVADGIVMGAGAGLWMAANVRAVQTLPAQRCQK